MRNCKIIILMMLLSFLFFTACASQNKSEKPLHVSDYSESAAKYMPLEIGNRWVYRVNYLGSVGEIEVVINARNEEWFVDNKGGKFLIDRRGIRDKDRYILMFPLQREEWVTIVDPRTREIRRTVGVDEKVNVPAGTFEGAIKVHTLVDLPENRVMHTYHYFVADVGIVKIDTVLENVREGKLVPQTSTELVEYFIKGSKS